MDRFDRFAIRLGHATAWLFVVGTAITVYEVLMRYLFAAPTTWVHVSTTALCALGFAAGGPYAMARDAHVRITSAIDHAAPRLQRAAEILGLVCGAIYLGGLTYAAVLQAADAVWRFESSGRWVPEAVPGPPHWPLPALTRVALAAGSALFLLLVLKRLVAALRPARLGESP